MEYLSRLTFPRSSEPQSPHETPRRAMDAALRSGLNQHVRPLGFSGSYPHLRRIHDDRISLLTVQFNQYGGKFAVEVGVCGPTGNRLQAPELSTVFGVGARSRARLGSETFPVGDHWFVFGPDAGHHGSANLQPDSHYRHVASDATSFIAFQAEECWRDAPLADQTTQGPDG